MFFSFAVHYGAVHPALAGDFEVDDAAIEEFRSFLADSTRQLEYKTPGERQIEELEALVEREHYGAPVQERIEELGQALSEEKSRDFDRSKEYIRMALRRELASRFWGSGARIEATFPEDLQLRTATDLLSDPQRYEELMSASVIAAGDEEAPSED